MLKRAALLLGSAAATCHCPTGAACDGNGTVVNRDDYWGEAGATTFHKCVPHRCLSNYQCARGYSGRLCARVDGGYY